MLYVHVLLVVPLSTVHQRLTCHREPNAESEETVKTYTAKEEAFADPELVQFHCPKYGGTVTCGGIVKQKTAKSIAIGRCENGDELFVRFKFTRWGDGRLGVSRIIYEINDNNRSYYLKKVGRSRRAFVLSASCQLGGEI